MKPCNAGLPSATQREDLIQTLKNRFEQNRNRHPHIEWAEVQVRLETYPEKLNALSEMERTGGEPDVVPYESASGEYAFYDCAPESPKERRSICYDEDALEARKANKPKNSACQMALGMGIEMLTEGQYRELQMLGNFDTKTSSWVKTPDTIRELGGPCFVTAASTPFLPITTVLNLTMQAEDFGVWCGCKRAKKMKYWFSDTFG